MAELKDLAMNLAVASGRFTRLATQLSESQRPRAMWRILAHLDERGPSRVTDLAKLEHVAQPTATGLVKRLRDAGHVQTEPDPKDARASLVYLTAQGREHLADLRTDMAAALAGRFTALTPHELTVLTEAVDLLTRLCAAPPAAEAPRARAAGSTTPARQRKKS